MNCHFFDNFPINFLIGFQAAWYTFVLRRKGKPVSKTERQNTKLMFYLRREPLTWSKAHWRCQKKWSHSFRQMLNPAFLKILQFFIYGSKREKLPAQARGKWYISFCSWRERKAAAYFIALLRLLQSARWYTAIYNDHLSAFTPPDYLKCFMIYLSMKQILVVTVTKNPKATEKLSLSVFACDSFCHYPNIPPLKEWGRLSWWCTSERWYSGG